MEIKITAIRTAGLGCIKGDCKIYREVESIEDCGEYYNLVIPSRNMKVRVAKANWELEEI